MRLHTIHASAVCGDPQTVTAVLKDVVDVVIAQTPTVVLIMDIVVHGFAVPAIKTLAFGSDPHPSLTVLLDRIDAVGKTCLLALQRARWCEVALLPALTVVDGKIAFAVASPKVTVTGNAQRAHFLVDDHRQTAHAMATEMQHREVALAREPKVVLIVDKRFLYQWYAGICRLTTI